MVVHSIHSFEEFHKTIQSHEIVIIDAYATWCGPCRAISPVFEKLSEFKSKAHFVKVDVDEVPDVAQELGIRAMPTFIFYEKGERTNHITGANPAALEIAIKSAIEMPKS